MSELIIAFTTDEWLEPNVERIEKELTSRFRDEIGEGNYELNLFCQEVFKAEDGQFEALEERGFENPVCVLFSSEGESARDNGQMTQYEGRDIVMLDDNLLQLLFYMEDALDKVRDRQSIEANLPDHGTVRTQDYDRISLAEFVILVPAEE